MLGCPEHAELLGPGRVAVHVAEPMVDLRSRDLGALVHGYEDPLGDRKHRGVTGEHGVADLSLRGLAAAIGTSHRMLIYHFDSKAGLLDDIVTSWLEPIAALRREQGVPPETARAQARLDLAVTRGLLLDLLATGDRAATTAAIEHYSALYESWREQQADSAPPPR